MAVLLTARLAALAALLVVAVSGQSDISSAVASSAVASSAAVSSAISSVAVSSAVSSAAVSSAAASSAVSAAAPSAAATSGDVGEVSGVSYTVSDTYTIYGIPAPTNPASVASSPTAGGEPPYNTGLGTEVGWQTLSVSSYAFTSYPVASPTADPPVYPALSPLYPPAVVNAGPQIVPDFSDAWDAAFARAEAFVSTLTLEQKVNVTTGTYWEQGLCVGNIGQVGDWPGLCLQDSPLGVRYTNLNTVFPAGIMTAATWNRTAMRLRGQQMGEEFRGKGVNVQLGPMMNMGRVAQGGRNWEGFGTDAFLSGEAAYETTLGIQSAGVQACAKHYIDYEQEYKRTQESSNVDDRTNHEIYLKPFLRAVMAGTASVMCSYNMINDTYACENDRTLNQLLKSELGFRGYIMSDWGGQESTLSAMAGLDMTMPGDITLGSGTSWWGPNLTAFVNNATIPLSRVDDMATRILAGYYLLGQDQNYPNVSFNAFNPYDTVHNLNVDVQADHYKIVREIGAEGAVLLKNTNNALPLAAPRSILVVGSDAGNNAMGANGCTDRGCDEGVLGIGWGSGSANFPYLISPFDALQERARQDATSISNWYLDWNTEGVAAIANLSDVALVFVNSDSGEGYITVDGNLGDRNNLSLWHNADNLINAVAAQNPNTIVIAHSVGPSIIEPWVENPNVTAIVWAGAPGQEAGNSIVDVLYGAYNPSGRLPYTIAKALEDYGVFLVLGGEGDTLLSIPYDEGLFYDYRRFDQYNITPRYEFGFGLSYTTFEYSNLATTVIPQVYDPTSWDLEAAWAEGAPTPQGEGSSVALWLHRPFLSVQFDLQNTGALAGTEIPQVYVHFPAGSGEPPSLLKGFDTVYIEAGAYQSVEITISRYELSVWNVVAQGWQKPSGAFTLSVGASSRDFKLTGAIPI
ncbi:beta-glucosidase [Fomitopsis serialis]|uniref:beta-glucosidase n=1 Tax=Fomitopsis serialis TaxID=139415 RepID=UPI0020085E6F|nr:beta-glucosidase [Neoantrodia serialis]KAH9921655.1 beta-glucosidase [Neoantrodia serialis]